MDYNVSFVGGNVVIFGGKIEVNSGRIFTKPQLKRQGKYSATIHQD